MPLVYDCGGGSAAGASPCLSTRLVLLVFLVALLIVIERLILVIFRPLSIMCSVGSITTPTYWANAVIKEG